VNDRMCPIHTIRLLVFSTIDAGFLPDPASAGLTIFPNRSLPSHYPYWSRKACIKSRLWAPTTGIGYGVKELPLSFPAFWYLKQEPICRVD